MRYLLASKHGIITGRNLARNLGLAFHTNLHKIKRAKVDVVFRYGNAQTNDRIIGDTEVNSVDAILRCSAKHKLWKMLEEEDIIAPEYIPYYYGMQIPERLGGKFLGRKRIHRAGNDIKILTRKSIITSPVEFLVPFIPTNREYRVHVLFGRIVKVLRKYPDNEENKGFIRTSRYGWNYRVSSLHEIVCDKSMSKTALKVAELLGLSFCGIDMAWSSKNDGGLHKWVVWEVNSAPSLNTPSLRTYTTYFKEYMGR